MQKLMAITPSGATGIRKKHLKIADQSLTVKHSLIQKKVFSG